LLRSYYFDEHTKEEVSSWFLAEGNFMFAVKSFVELSPSFENIIAEEDSTVVILKKSDLESLLSKYAVFGQIQTKFL
jgi:hypothetical protein